jgi:transcriptional regulator with XRE-family HTH domain
MRESSDQRFGKRLRLERERRRITLDSIASNTKIGIALLKGLERDDVSRWPSGIFRRSFIREYAAAIGLDPDETAREFLERFPDPAEPIRPARARASEAPVLRLTLADTGPWFVRELVDGSWRRWAAVAWDLATCLLVGSALFLVLGRWWKPLAITAIGYYVLSTLLLGNTPGVFIFGRMATGDAGRDMGASASPMRVALSRIRRRLSLEEPHAAAPPGNTPDAAPQMEHLISRSTP